MIKWFLLFLFSLTALADSQNSIGHYPFKQVRTVYSSTNITTGAWVQLVSATSSHTGLLEIFDSSGQTLEIGTGAVGSEVAILYVFPGGNGPVSVNIPPGVRVAIKALSGTANAGEGDLNFYD